MTGKAESLCLLENNQDQIDRFLVWGIVFSLFWIWGIGSFVALIMGLKAREAILESNGVCHGSIRVWWCLLFGGVGVVWTTAVVVLAYIKNVVF